MGMGTAFGNPPNHLVMDFVYEFKDPDGRRVCMVIRFSNAGGTAALCTKEALDHGFGRQQILVERARDALRGLFGEATRLIYGTLSIELKSEWVRRIDAGFVFWNASNGNEPE